MNVRTIFVKVGEAVGTVLAFAVYFVYRLFGRGNFDG